MRKRISRWINCHIFGMHEWTCNASEGIKPNEQQLKEGMSAEQAMAGFKDYAKMYCKNCKKESKLNDRL